MKNQKKRGPNLLLTNQEYQTKITSPKMTGETGITSPQAANITASVPSENPPPVRTYKDTLFVHLFCTDRDGKKNFLDLYNTLNGTNLPYESTEIKDVHIEGVLYTTQRNDVSMMVDNKVIMLCEQQSTVNRNMPLRFLMYIAKVYERQLPPEIKFKRAMQKIPRPQFLVFYNGKDDLPPKQTLSLKDAFEEGDLQLSKEENTLFDLTVTVYNINTPDGKNEWEKCRPLLEYTRFVNIAREERSVNPEGYMDRTINRALEEGVLTDYLNRNAREVRNMFIGEYDYATDIAVQRDEAFEEGVESGRAEGRAEGEAIGEERGRAEGEAIGERNKALETARNLLRIGLSIEQIADVTGLTETEVLTLQI